MHSKMPLFFANTASRIHVFACLISMTILTSVSMVHGGQQWSVNQVPDLNPVPQYVPPMTSRSAPTTAPPARPDASSPRSTAAQNAASAPLPDFFDRSANEDDNDTLVANPLRSRPPAPKRSFQETLPGAQTPSTPRRPSTIEPALTSLPRPIVHPQNSPRLKTPRSVTTRSPMEPALELPIPIAAAPSPSVERSSKKTSERKYTVDYSIYRDTSPYPIDPRKPCPQCTIDPSNCRCKLLGNQGRHYLDKELGGCQCNSRSPWKHPDFSVHWPRPFSAKIDERRPAAAAARYSACQPERIVDVFDSLSTLKISKYKRSDNGYCGPNSDPFGCLGESKFAK